MSTRALRKLQREQEQEKQLAALSEDGAQVDTDEAEEEESIPSFARAKAKKKRKEALNAFRLLEQEDEDADEHIRPETSSDKGSDPPEVHDLSGISTPQSAKPKRKKKRKPKDKGKYLLCSASNKIEPDQVKKPSSEVDDIDRALQELNMRKCLTAEKQDNDQDSQALEPDTSWEKEISRLLAVESKNLNPTNEMKSLFGSIALERPTRNQARPDEEGRVDLETALSGKHSPVSRGKELGTLAKRRNVFMQGQEHWPLATSGGLGMEVVKDSGDADSRSDTTSSIGKHYKIVHNSAYKDTQRQFRQAVESLSADAMIQLLLYHPYHVATLLQVAEIAKHQGDHSVTGDLLERALFTFGRSVHSTFGVSVREGRARLGFDETSNRELYLAIWRYIQNLEMRGTWRTAFEWSKMLLSFNILSDPYGITHVLDQYALRGRQHHALIELCSEAAFGNTWSHLPNVQISLALAYHRASQPKLARQKLALAMHRYPYILSHLCSTLDISPLPKHLWGVIPSTDAEKLYTELYVTRAKDLWATPETTALLVEVAETIDSYSHFWRNEAAPPKLEIALEDARHIFLLEIPALIALIPAKFRNRSTAQYDVLPPPSSTQDEGLTARAPATSDGPGQLGMVGTIAEILRAASRGLFGSGTATTTPGNIHRNHNNQDPDEDDEDDDAVLNYNLLNAGIDPATTNPTEADQAAILAALAEFDRIDSTSYSDTDTDSAINQAATLPPHREFPPEPQPSTTELEDLQAEALVRQDRDEESPHPSQSFTEPDLVRNPTGARLTPVPDRDEAADDAPHSPSPHRPRPRESSRSLPPAPTVEDEPETPTAGPPSTSTSSAATRSEPRQRPPSTFPPRTTTDPPQPAHPPHPATAQTPPQPDPHQIQRYLLTTGLDALQRSLAPAPSVDASARQSTAEEALREYTRRLHSLRPREREWVLGVVGQRVRAGAGGGGGGEGRDAEELVRRIREALG